MPYPIMPGTEVEVLASPAMPYPIMPGTEVAA